MLLFFLLSGRALDHAIAARLSAVPQPGSAKGRECAPFAGDEFVSDAFRQALKARDRMLVEAEASIFRPTASCLAANPISMKA